MGWYIVIKTIKGHRYRYRQRTWREGKHVRTQCICLGREDALAAGVEPIIWRRKEGARVITRLQRAVRAHGFAAEMVGSVGTAGESSKDLDVLLKAREAMNTQKALAAIEAIRKTYPVVQFEDDIVGFSDELGRTVEIFLGDVPERVWGSAKFRDQMWAWINEDAARFAKAAVAGIQARDTVRATNRKTGQVVEREVRSVKENGFALVEPTSGIPFRYSSDLWSFEVIKKAPPSRPLQFKSGDRFIDKRDGEVMTIKKVWRDKGKYLLEGTSGADATVSEVGLLEGFSPVFITDLENELRALYVQFGSGLIAGETLPAKPSPDDILDFGEEDKSFAERLASWRQDVDALTGQSKIRKAFEVVRAELELSEAGYRVIGDDAHQHGGTGAHGVPSTFPKWIPERLRRKRLFERLMPVLDAENISYPARRSASRQRDLYHLILDRVDHLAGIDTATIREKIMATYGQSEPDD